MIKIQNIYYMLAYAFQILNEQGYKKLGTEEFDNVAELCAAILIRGIKTQINRGLGKDYIQRTESISSLRGKINISESINAGTLLRRQMICSYDDLTVNSYMNSIIKSTVVVLLKSKISRKRKKDLRQLMMYFVEVDSLDIHSIDWNIQYNKNNQTYRMLISICYLVIKGLLQNHSDGTAKLIDYFDEQKMHRLYEKFIFEYYNVEYKKMKVKASANMMDWQVDDGFRELLPRMKTDITLTCGDRTLIIDAKYYEHNLRGQYGKTSIPSDNLYQIFTYVKTKENELSRIPHQKVSGMLLYAQTDNEGAFNNEYQMMGNRICARTLDLSADFASIKKQLDEIAEKYLLVKVK